MSSGVTPAEVRAGRPTSVPVTRRPGHNAAQCVVPPGSLFRCPPAAAGRTGFGGWRRRVSELAFPAAPADCRSAAGRVTGPRRQLRTPCPLHGTVWPPGRPACVADVVLRAAGTPPELRGSPTGGQPAGRRHPAPTNGTVGRVARNEQQPQISAAGRQRTAARSWGQEMDAATPGARTCTSLGRTHSAMRRFREASHGSC